MEQLQQSVISRLQRLCKDIAIIKRDNPINKPLLMKLKYQRRLMDQLMNKINNDIINGDNQHYNDYLRDYKDNDRQG